MKKLILITDNFPYDPGGSFVTNEMKFYNSFDDVYVYCIKAQNKTPIVDLPDNIHATPINYRGKKINFAVLLKWELYKELFTLCRTNRLSLYNIYAAMLFFSKSLFYSKYIKTSLKDSIDPNDNLFLYSYWMREHAMTIALLSKETDVKKTITRVHGYDLYEYRQKRGYLPFRQFIFNNVDTICPISNDGLKYLRERYRINNVELSRLGTYDYGIQIQQNKPDEFTIVSCSWCSPVKRIDRIVNSLAAVSDLSIRWIHIGEGETLESVIQAAKKQLNNNIHCEFIGALSNPEIMSFYKSNYVDVFVNVSESEGIPVSIMEAISFGIPVMATNVGGNSEIVVPGISGYLLDSNFSTKEFVDYIHIIHDMSNEDISQFRSSVRNFWEKNYYAEKNYSSFFGRFFS